jgi:NAD(P)H dehydrogenase (quinone)
MQVLLVIAHPRPDSFNHALGEQVIGAARDLGMSVVVQDLYRDGFDPVLPASETYTSGSAAASVLSASSDPLVRQYRADIAASDALVAIHPNWWGKPPAMMSGWIDRILIPGVAYDLTDAAGLPRGLLNLGWALVLNTGDTPPERERVHLGDPLEAIWRECILGFCGVLRVRRRLYGPLAGSTLAQRLAWLADAKGLVTELDSGAP